MPTMGSNENNFISIRLNNNKSPVQNKAATAILKNITPII